MLWKELLPREVLARAGAAEGGSPGGRGCIWPRVSGGSSQVSATEGAPLVVHCERERGFVSDIDHNTENDPDVPEGPMLLPLDGWHRARGARMVEFAGYAMPVQYEGIIAEHLWTRESAGLFDVSHMGQLEVSAQDDDAGAEKAADMGRAVAALEALLPADPAALKPGRVRYSLLLGEDGGILDDLMVTNRGDHFYLVVNGATKWDDIAHLRENLPDDITLNHLDEHALLALQGPKAA